MSFDIVSEIEHEGQIVDFGYIKGNYVREVEVL